MEKFTLISNQIVSGNGQITLIVYPNHLYLNEKINYGETIDAKMDIQTQIDNIIQIQTPIMFEQIQQMESIPQYIKDNIEL